MKNDRNLQIQDIVSVYTNRFVCACMADNMADEEREQIAANTWMMAQKSANNITNEEMEEAIRVLEKKAEDEGQPFAYDKTVMM